MLNDANLLFNKCIVTDIDGDEHIGENRESIERYQERAVSFDVFSDSAWASGLANWYVNNFGEPIPRIERVTIPLHSENYATMSTMLPLTIGSAVNVINVLPGSDDPVTLSYSVDGVEISIRSLDSESGSCFYDLTLRLWPLDYLVEWELDASKLGNNSRLGRPTSYTSLQDLLGRIHWFPGDIVTKRVFQAAAGQLVATYPSTALRDRTETNPREGQMCYITGTRELQVFRHGRWVVYARIPI